MHVKFLNHLFAAMFAAAAVLFVSVPGAQAQDKRSVSNVKGDVYRFQNNFHFAMFVVTSDGIVVTDPINADAVGWLKAELAKRFPGKRVTHMIYSHSHGDHNSGGQAWGDGVEVIAHENTAKNLAGSNQTAIPTKTYKDSYSFSTGGKSFLVKFLGNGHGNDLAATVVGPEKVAFVVDAVSPKRLPFRDFPRADIQGIVDQIKTIESLDFDILTPGHSVNGTKQDATDQRIYIETLMAAVKKEMAAGKSVDQIKGSVKMEAYKDWSAYEQFLPLNIEGMYNWLKSNS